MTYQELSDSDLVAGYNEGIVECFTEIYNRYWAILYRHALRMLRDECSSQDVVQETFHSLIRHGSIQETAPLRLFLYTTLRNRIINNFRREKVREKYLASLKHHVCASECTDIQVRERELQRQIEMEISRLPERMRLTFELSRKQHCDYKTIAERTSTSTETVRKQIHNAIRILRTKLSYF